MTQEAISLYLSRRTQLLSKIQRHAWWWLADGWRTSFGEILADFVATSSLDVTKVTLPYLSAQTNNGVRFTWLVCGSSIGMGMMGMMGMMDSDGNGYLLTIYLMGKCPSIAYTFPWA